MYPLMLNNKLIFYCWQTNICQSLKINFVKIKFQVRKLALYMAYQKNTEIMTFLWVRGKFKEYERAQFAL